MLQTRSHFSLKAFNTFHVEAFASEFISIKTVDDLRTWIRSSSDISSPVLVLGGGSNLLFINNFNGIVVKPDMDAIEIVEETYDDIIIEVGAGRNWDSFVDFCVSNGYYGIENLSLIPGNTGAAPVQNIGAYGVEVKDVIGSVKGVYLADGEAFCFSNTSCNFDYRQSIFKNELKGKAIITNVVFKLSKKVGFNLGYGHVKEQVEKNGEVSLQNVRDTIITIRNNKLPDPEITGNAGSFFKNPVISASDFNQLKKDYPDIPGYPVSIELVKVPAGWLIEQAGWKGKNIGPAGVHSQQALVLINLGGATGNDILHLSSVIEDDIKSIFGISLEKEINVVG